MVTKSADRSKTINFSRYPDLICVAGFLFGYFGYPMVWKSFFFPPAPDLSINFIYFFVIITASLLVIFWLIQKTKGLHFFKPTSLFLSSFIAGILISVIYYF